MIHLIKITWSIFPYSIYTSIYIFWAPAFAVLNKMFPSAADQAGNFTFEHVSPGTPRDTVLYMCTTHGRTQRTCTVRTRRARFGQ